MKFSWEVYIRRSSSCRFLIFIWKLEKCFLQASQNGSSSSSDGFTFISSDEEILQDMGHVDYMIFQIMLIMGLQLQWVFAFPMRWRERWGTQLLVFGMFWLQCKLHQHYSRISMNWLSLWSLTPTIKTHATFTCEFLISFLFLVIS